MREGKLNQDRENTDSTPHARQRRPRSADEMTSDTPEDIDAPESRALPLAVIGTAGFGNIAKGGVPRA